MTDARLFTVTDDDDGIRLDRWFKRHLPDVSFNIVSRWARTGQLRVDGERAAPGDRIAAGQRLSFPRAEAEPARTPRPRVRRDPLSAEDEQYVREMVIYRDPSAFVLNKPPGLATQGGTKTHQHLDRLLDGLADEGGARPKLVHRLDKDTSGALLVARTSRAAAHFAREFSGRAAKKVYWALVVGVPDANDGTIDAPLAKQPGTGGEKMYVDPVEGLPSRTRWRVIDRAGNRAAWVELQPLTGRTHQLRVHMAALGHPIVGDAKYGGAEAFLTGGVSRKLHLHARRIRIDSPEGGKLDVTADLPAHMAETLATMGFVESEGDNLAPIQTPPVARRIAKPKADSRRGERRARIDKPKGRRR